MSERWLVAMSGGVDSSVAAAVLARAGYDLVGVTMDLGQGEGEAGSARRALKRCCGLPDVEDARAVARTLGIRHYTVNYRQPFREAVIEPFLEEYRVGRTPIPCIACNRVLKFDLLLRRAQSLGARGVATGHYARIAPAPDGLPALYRAPDRDKDQSYFLFDVPRETLSRLRFPVGEMKKSEVRELARSLALNTADKPESQGICFVPDGDVKGALRRLAPGTAAVPGEIVDEEGRRLGTHGGAVGYTLGQRKGLGLANGPWYVNEICVQQNRIVVDRARKLERRELSARGVSWLDGKLPLGPVRVQIRHRHESVAARVELTAAVELRLHLEAPVWAPAAGQAAVVYDETDTRVLGGGWIAGSA
jgi:tRNA-specific 2-thiouridylase